MLRLPQVLLHDIPDGTPFIRDQNNPCYDFQPGEPKGTCQTDGHYICAECKHLDPNHHVALRDSVQGGA